MNCPYILVTILGVHPHPVPLPLKTPPSIRKEILRLLGSVDEDLPDLTPRKFLRHPILKDYLQQHFPNVQPPPTLSNLHVSLANREHLNVYIETAKEQHFPAGTGWEGVTLLKKIQDETLPPEEHYIRRIINLSNIPSHDEDDPVTDGNGKDVRIVICMSRQASWRLRATSYAQSDMAFARIAEYHEFEIASVDRINNTGMSFQVFQINYFFKALSTTSHNLLSCVRYTADSCCTPADLSRDRRYCGVRHGRASQMASPSCSAYRRDGGNDSSLDIGSAWRAGQRFVFFLSVVLYHRIMCYQVSDYIYRD